MALRFSILLTEGCIVGNWGCYKVEAALYTSEPLVLWRIRRDIYFHNYLWAWCVQFIMYCNKKNIAIYLLNIIKGIFELFQHEKNGKFLERLQTFRKSLSICGRAGNQVFMWFVTFWGCPEPIFSTRGQIWCENETFAEINLLHKIASNSETVWSWEKFRTIPESCWHCLSTCTGCAAITSTIWLLQGVL